MTSKNILRILFWLLLGGVLAISIMPVEDAPVVFANDKLNHILAFFVLSFMARILWSRASTLILFSMLTLFGGGIELLQLAMGFGRDADSLDFAADVLAIALGMLCAHGINGMRSKSVITE